MIEVTRELVAYVLIGVTVAGGGVALLVAHRRRKRQRLRRRGIKTYGH